MSKKLNISRKNTNEVLDEDFYDYAQELEKQWKQSQPRLSEKELLSIYPAILDEIPQKLVDLKEDREGLTKKIRERIIEIRNLKSDEFSKWFVREFLKNTLVKELVRLEREIFSLERLRLIAEGKPQKGRITEDQIDRALNVPILDIASQKTRLRKSGRNYYGFCPLHEEKHPSFYVFTETNSCWCFGCQRGGNTINLSMLFYGFSFKEAVKDLIGG